MLPVRYQNVMDTLHWNTAVHFTYILLALHWNIATYFNELLLHTAWPWSIWFIQSVSHWSFSSKASKYHKLQTVRSRELKFWENVHPLKLVTCHISHVTCHVSHFMCHVSHVTYHVSHVKCQICFHYFFCLDKVLKFISGGFVIIGAYPV